MLNNIW